MSHIKTALKKVILERLSLVKGYPYFRKYLDNDGLFIAIWKDEEDNLFVAEGHALVYPSFETFKNFPLEDRKIYNSFDRSLAVDYFINRLEELDNE